MASYSFIFPPSGWTTGIYIQLCPWMFHFYSFSFLSELALQFSSITGDCLVYLIFNLKNSKNKLFKFHILKLLFVGNEEDRGQVLGHLTGKDHWCDIPEMQNIVGHKNCTSTEIQ